MDLEARILEVLERNGPCPGKELMETLGEEVFHIWRACILSEYIVTKTVGRRYLRFDRSVEGYARLSPSPQREFMTYTVVGLEKQRSELEGLALELEREIKEISAAKEVAARDAVEKVLRGLGGLREKVETGACFILGGDVPLAMAHGDPRPEKSTGLLVAGSDLDLVVVHRDDFSSEEVKALDDVIYSEKYALLMNPRQKEELDYIVKPFSRVKAQAAFQDFEDMVACKIIMEGRLLAGSWDLYREIMALMEEHQIKERLQEMEKRAQTFRKEAEARLLESEDLSEEDYLTYFSTTEEIGEIF